MTFPEPEEQLARLARLSEEIIPEPEFLQKAARARREVFGDADVGLVDPGGAWEEPGIAHLDFPRVHAGARSHGRLHGRRSRRACLQRGDALAEAAAVDLQIAARGSAIELVHRTRQTRSIDGARQQTRGGPPDVHFLCIACDPRSGGC